MRRNCENTVNEQYFSGDEKSLFNYWNSADRAKKFTKGATRTSMVNFVINKEAGTLAKKSWLDVGIGAGFVQKIYQGDFCNIIGLDISIAMLLLIDDERVFKIAGSFLKIPLRKNCINIASSFFCLSDYPELKRNLTLISSCIEPEGVLIYVDYSQGDDYWERRKNLHETEGIVGNINLRSTEEIKDNFENSKDLTCIHTETVEFNENSKDMILPIFELPKTLMRRFLFIKLKKL
jgi:ubiquinone/menaquinone biosynthesis C-methylase UbiE